MINIWQTILAGFLASLAWFILGGALYMNPLVDKIYKSYKESPALKKWASLKKYIINMYLLGILIPSLIFAFVYAFINPIFPENLVLKILYFGLIMIGVRIMTRFFDMWLQTSYPNKLLVIEIINGIIGSFVIALILALIIK